MRLTPREQDKLLIVVAADLAARRKARGLKLNHPEAVALITAFVFEEARDGRTVEDTMVAAAKVLTRADVMDGVAELIPDVQVEATFPDGTKLVTVHDPIGGGTATRTPGEYFPLAGDVALNVGRNTVQISVTNQGDRPVQVGSHYHFYEVNPALAFDRGVAYGRRLAIPAGLSVRFEPGDTKTVTLVPYGGAREVHGHRGAVQGKLKP